MFRHYINRPRVSSKCNSPNMPYFDEMRHVVNPMQFSKKTVDSLCIYVYRYGNETKYMDIDMTPMEAGTRQAVNAMKICAQEQSDNGHGIAAMEVLNGAMHLVSQSMFIPDADKATINNDLEGQYYTIKAVWKNQSD